MDKRIQEILEKIAESCRKIFAESLTGIYVHGSLALGCFNWEKSDIDFLVVVKRTPSLEQKKQFIKDLLEIDQAAPPKGLEMSLVLEKYTRNFVYPTPFELHFSNAHKQSCRDNPEEYCRLMKGTDKDLAAHFTVIRTACITLYGESERKVFGEVPPADYLDSIKWDIENATEEIKENPIYMILNLCRVRAYQKDGLVLSKRDGGHWGIDHLPGKYAEMILEAVRCYQSGDLFHSPGEDLLIGFADDMRREIFETSAKVLGLRD